MNRFFVAICVLCLTLLPAFSVFAAGESCDPKSGACSSCPAAAACAADGKAVSAAADEKPAAPAADLPVVNTSALKAMISAKVPVVLLDARTGKYDDGKRLPGAKALAPTATAEEAAKAIPAKDAFVVTYCAGPKCPASNALYEGLKKLGYTNLAEYPEGIEGWTKAGNEVTTAK